MAEVTYRTFEATDQFDELGARKLLLYSVFQKQFNKFYVVVSAEGSCSPIVVSPWN